MSSLNGGAPGWIGAPAGDPIWSPTGKSVAWGSEDGLLIWDSDDDSVRQIAQAAVAGVPAWSPDGEIVSYIDRDAALLVSRDVDSGHILFQAPVATEPGLGPPPALVGFGGPSWSPDGSRLAFVCWDGAGDEICVIDAAGEDITQVTWLEPADAEADGDAAIQPARSNVGPPAWAPDGARIAVAAYPERRGAPAGVFIIELERGNARRVSRLKPNSAIQWYPDGESILFSAIDDGRSDAVRVSIADARAEKLSTSLELGARSPSLSGNGELVAVSSGDAIVVLFADGTVASDVGVGLRGTTPTLSPAGRAIAFKAVPDPLVNYD